MSGSTIGSVVGGTIGFVAGGPAGAQIGWMIGGIVGGIVDPQKIYGPRLTDARTQYAQDGTPCTRGYGTFPTTGCIIWQDELKEHKKKDSGKGGPVNITYTYTGSYAIGVCAGPINGYLIIERNGKIVYDTRDDATLTALGYTSEQISEQRAAQAKFEQVATFYYGDYTQLPDPTMQAALGANNVPANRGYAYIVCTDEDLTNEGGAVPQYRFVVSVCGTRDTSFVDDVRFLGASAAHPGYNGEVRELTFGGHWAGADHDLGFSNSQQNAYARLGDGLIVGRTGVANYRVASRFDLDSWQTGAPYAGDHLAVSGGRLLIAGYNTNRIYYMGSVFDATATASNPITGGSNSNNPIMVVGDGIRALAMSGYGDCFYSDDNGVNWTARPWVLVNNSNPQRAIDINRNAGRICVASYNHGTIYRTDDFGVTFTAATMTPSIPAYTADAYQLKYCGGGVWLYAVGVEGQTSYRGIWKSTDNGATFTRQTQAPINDIYFENQYQNCIAVDKNSGAVVVAARKAITNAHVFFVSYDYTNWTQIDMSGTYATSVLELFPLTAPSDLIPIPDAPGVFWNPATHSYVGGHYTTLDPCTPTLGEIVDAECARRGVLATDTTELVDGVAGFRIASNTNARANIQALQSGYFFDGSEYDGILHFPKRNSSPDFALTKDDLVARDGDAIEFEIVKENDLLRKVTIGYADPDTTYNDTTQDWERRATTINAQGEGTVSLAITGTKDWAKQTAEKTINSAWSENQTLRFTVSIAHAYLVPAQTGTITDADGIVHTIRIERIEDDGAMRNIEAVRIKGDSYSSAAIGVPSPLPEYPGSDILGPTVSALLNIPALRTVDDSPGLYWAARGVTGGWSGAQLQIMRNGTWEVAETIDAASTMGTLAAILPAADRDYTDESNTLTVSVNDPLSSVTFEQMLDGANAAAILYPDGTAEIVQWQTATANGDNYDLNTLQRGRKDTTAGTHPSGASFVVLDGGVRFIQLAASDFGATITYRVVTLGTDPDAADVETITLATLESAREWSVSNLTATRDSSDNVTVTWDGRPRLGTNVQPQQSQYFSGYRVEYSDGSTTIRKDIARTPLVIVNGIIDTDETTTHTYSAADQTADFGTLPSSLTVTVSAVNTISGAGPTETTSA